MALKLKPIFQDLLPKIFFSLLILVYLFIVNRYNGVQVPVAILAVTVIIVSIFQPIHVLGAMHML